MRLPSSVTGMDRPGITSSQSRGRSAYRVGKPGENPPQQAEELQDVFPIPTIPPIIFPSTGIPPSFPSGTTLPSGTARSDTVQSASGSLSVSISPPASSLNGIPPAITSTVSPSDAAISTASHVSCTSVLAGTLTPLLVILLVAAICIPRWRRFRRATEQPQPSDKERSPVEPDSPAETRPADRYSSDAQLAGCHRKSTPIRSHLSNQNGVGSSDALSAESNSTDLVLCRTNESEDRNLPTPPPRYSRPLPKIPVMAY